MLWGVSPKGSRTAGSTEQSNSRLKDMTWLPKSVVCLRYYDRFRFRADVFAALVLALQLFPLAIAIAIASGLPPLYGISCAAIASLLASALGNSKIRISAPNVVLVAIASSIVGREGVLGLCLSTFIAGFLLMFFGAIGLGAAFQRLPRPVAIGFSTGIAALVVMRELPELLGVGSAASANETFRSPLTVVRQLTHIDPHGLVLAVAAFVLVAASSKKFERLPASLMVVAAGALLVKLGNFPMRTVEVLYGSGPTSFHLHAAGLLRPDLVPTVLGSALAIAVLVGMESLQAIEVASRLSGEESNPDGELLVHGGVNVACAVAGGLPASGASSYTSENAHSGAQTPLAGMLQAAFLVLLLIVATPLVRFIPLPAISAIILLSVCSMSHWREIPKLIRPKWADGAAWLAVSVLTIVTSLSVAISIGMLIGMFLYTRDQANAGAGEASKT